MITPEETIALLSTGHKNIKRFDMLGSNRQYGSRLTVNFEMGNYRIEIDAEEEKGIEKKSTYETTISITNPKGQRAKEVIEGKEFFESTIKAANEYDCKLKGVGFDLKDIEASANGPKDEEPEDSRTPEERAQESAERMKAYTKIELMKTRIMLQAMSDLMKSDEMRDLSKSFVEALVTTYKEVEAQKSLWNNLLKPFKKKSKK